MSFSYLFDPNKQFQDRNGVNNVGGFLRVYIDGTDDRATTYKDFNGTLNEADIMLDTDGRAVVIVDDNLTFRIEVYERDGALQWTVTQFTARGEGGGGGSSTPVVVDGTANEIDVTESMTAGVKYYKIGLATVVKNTLLGLIASFSNLVGILNSKADKVQVATAGNLAALDASGNLTDSGSKSADFKTKQTPVADPSASGNGLEFIDSISQDANGEITPHKKSVQDGTTAQKGVVQLQDSIGSTESVTDKAVTPHAVREAINAAVSSAYHAAGTKSVAQLTSSLLVAENEGCVYNVTDSGTTTSDFVDGAGHPINAGDNVGVCDVGGGVYKFDLLSGFVDLTNYLTKTGDASNTTSSLTKASGDTSTMTSGSKLSAIFTAISSFFASVASALGGKADKANITGATKCKITYNGQGIVTSGADLDASDIPNLAASKITSGTFGTDRIADDAITADKVKDNETLPVNVSGTATHLDCYGFWHTYGTGYYDSSKPYAKIGELNLNVSGNTGAGQLLQFELDSDICARVRLDIKWSNGSLQRANVLIIDSSVDYSTLKDWIKITHFTYTSGGNTFLCIRLYVKFTDDWQVWRVRQLDCQTGDCGYTNWADFPLRVGYGSQYAAEYGTLATYKFCYPYANGQVGSPSQPVYVDSNGQVQPCTQGATLKSNTATLYIAGYTDNNIPYYHVKDIKNGCVNHVDFSGITDSTCDITFEAPTLSTGEEYDYIISLEGYTNNSGYSTGPSVENCKQVLYYDSVNNLWRGEPLFLQATDWRQICVVRGNTCEWKRVALS